MALLLLRLVSEGVAENVEVSLATVSVALEVAEAVAVEALVLLNEDVGELVLLDVLAGLAVALPVAAEDAVLEDVLLEMPDALFVAAEDAELEVVLLEMPVALFVAADDAVLAVGVAEYVALSLATEGVAENEAVAVRVAEVNIRL